MLYILKVEPGGVVGVKVGPSARLPKTSQAGPDLHSVRREMCRLIPQVRTWADEGH